MNFSTFFLFTIRFQQYYIILKEGIIKQINICKQQIKDLKENIDEIKKKSTLLKETEDETNKRIKTIKKEIDGLKEQLLLLEKEDTVPPKYIY